MPFTKGHKINVGRICSKETRLKISIILKGKKLSKETKKKLSKALTGRKLSEETKKRISKTMKGQIPTWLIGKPLSEEHKRKLGMSEKGKKHYAWKGNNAGYSAVHNWIVREKGEPKICEFCGATAKEKRLHWANIDHTYKRKIDDYIAMCPVCHNKYDVKHNGKNWDKLMKINQKDGKLYKKEPDNKKPIIKGIDVPEITKDSVPF